MRAALSDSPPLASAEFLVSALLLSRLAGCYPLMATPFDGAVRHQEPLNWLHGLDETPKEQSGGHALMKVRG